MSIESVMLSISSSAIPFSFCLQSFPASRSFPMNQLFASGGQSTRGSASASVLLMNVQDWFFLGLTGLISLQSWGLSRVFSSMVIQKHQFFCSHPFELNSRFHFNITCFSDILFLFQNPSRGTMLHWAVPSPSLLWSVIVPQYSLDFYDLIVLRILARCPEECSPVSLGLMYFSQSDWSLEFGRRQPQEWRALYITSYQGLGDSHMMFTVILTFTIWFR